MVVVVDVSEGLGGEGTQKQILSKKSFSYSDCDNATIHTSLLTLYLNPNGRVTQMNSILCVWADIKALRNSGIKSSWAIIYLLCKELKYRISMKLSFEEGKDKIVSLQEKFGYLWLYHVLNQ